MKSPLSDKKTLLRLMLGTLVILCLASLTWFALRVYDVLEYFGSETAAAPESPTSAEDDEEAKINGATPPPAGTQPGSQAKGSAGSSRQISISPRRTGELPPPATPPAGYVRQITVDLPPEACAWAEEGKHPAIGDVIRVTIPDAREYLVEVRSFTEEPGSKTVDGQLSKCKGYCYMLALKGRISIHLEDLSHSRVYKLYYHKGVNSYTVLEIDPSLIPPAI